MSATCCADHHKHAEFSGPRFFIYNAQLEMHPLDTADRLDDLRGQDGIGYCNITKCCTKVCPEDIQITDNGIHPAQGARRRPVLRSGHAPVPRPDWRRQVTST